MAASSPACVSYRIGDAVFVGDALFMPDYGTARADFPGGSAHTLYQSIQKLLALPPATRLFMCHDYKAPGRDSYAWESTVAEERARSRDEHEPGPLRVFARVDNALDQRYIGSIIVNDGNQRYYEPGPDRAYTVGLQWQWQR